MSNKSQLILETPLLLQLMIQNLPELAYAFSIDGKIVAWNRNVEIGSGLSREELKNSSILDFVQKEDKTKVLNKFTEVVSDKQGKDQIIEYNLQSKSGNLFPVIALRSMIVVDGIEYFIGIAISKSRLFSEEGALDKITDARDQFEAYFLKLEEKKRNEILLLKEMRFNTDAFNSKLINSMPGIFYAYEKIGDTFFLKKWNSNYTADLGYPDDELLDVHPDQFFSKEEFEKVKEALKLVFTLGKARVEIYTTHKNGKQIPYFYEAYLFEDEGRQYFVGVGLDISVRYDLEKEKQQQELREQKAKEKLDANKRELIATALQISKTNKTIDYTLKQLDKLIEVNKGSSIFNELSIIKNDLKAKNSEQDNWEVFKLRFTDIHKEFFSGLKLKHPSLTKTELKFCAYLRIQLSSAQIASVLSVTNEAIKKSRYRIRKKTTLLPTDSLEDYICTF